jgi:hypothetical protein
MHLVIQKGSDVSLFVLTLWKELFTPDFFAPLLHLILKMSYS